MATTFGVVDRIKLDSVYDVFTVHYITCVILSFAMWNSEKNG